MRTRLLQVLCLSALPMLAQFPVPNATRVLE